MEVHWMKLKKICAAMLSAVMLTGSLAFPGSGNPLSFLGDAGKVTTLTAEAANSVMRRPCSPDQPMLIVHIDTWNYADPAKIIALIPEDIKPYVVFNISMSINWSNTDHKWLMVQDGYECARSWLKTCADEGVWCMVQPASGGQCHLPDYDSAGNIVNFPNKAEFTAHADEDYENTIYAEFFRDYPNFIGFNYSEQFWGFESQDFPVTPIQRYQHFAKLLKLCNKYGGYLNINWCANYWSAALNPVAMLKRCPEWRSACEQYSANLQLEEKYTQVGFIEDVESEVLGAYLSGYCGNFGVRYDETGWTDSSWSGTGTATKDQYRQITGLPIHLERMALNGATVIDGPELVWADDFAETWGGTKDGSYSCRSWTTRDQYVNDTLDFFRKVIDGTIRIPTRQEVIDRTKVVVIQDNNTGDNHNQYSTYPTLFEGLYRMSGDGNLDKNYNPYKSTGRYPTIPTVYALRDDLAKTFPVQIKQSSIPSRWSSISAKQDEFNKLFASDYYGNCYAGRYENTWVTYNPNKDGSNCGAVLSLKYNTCKDLDVNFNQYGNALIKEYSDRIDIYANNFDEKAQTTLRTDTFKISGCSAKLSYTAKDTGRNQTKSQISESYADGTYTLTVKHNGPVEISIQCRGSQSGRLTDPKQSTVKAPASPAFYTGIRQYEGEFFDTQNVEENVANGCGSGVTGFWGQGFLKYGAKNNAAVRDTVKTAKAGKFDLTVRYSATADINNVDLYVNGSKIKTLSMPKGSSYSDWKTVTQSVDLKAGENKIELRSNAALAGSLYLDCFTVKGEFGSAAAADPEPINGRIMQGLTVFDKENAADWSICYDPEAGSLLYGDRDITITSIPKNLEHAEAIRTACDSKMYTKDLGKFTVSQDATIYAAVDTRVTRNMPDWLKAWTYAGCNVTSSNDVTLELYKLHVQKGEAVVLGTNGGSGNSANYMIFAVPRETIVKGDVNLDGVINGFDLILAKRGMANGFTDTRAFDAADVDQDEKLEKDDLDQLQAYIKRSAKGFTQTPLTKPAPAVPADPTEEPSIAVDPDTYMAQISAKVVESEPANAAAENAGTAYGTYEKKTIYSSVCNRNKSFNVLLPAGYTTTRKYPVLYVLHGYWGDEDALLDKGDASLRLRQIIGNAIASGEAEDMIVVFPDIYASATQDKCDGLNDKNNKAYDNFINLLTKEIMPYMEQNYSIKTGRDNTAITGFSMGGRESLFIGFSRPDLFGYVGAMCPAPGLNTDQIPAEDLKFNGARPYLLFVSAGSNDTLIYSTPAGYHDTMNKNNVNHIWHYVTGGDHGGKTIRPHMYNYVRSIFKAAK